MKIRRRAEPNVLGFQIAPMVDVLLVLLCFFIVTWSFARKENELDVKVPSAENAKESMPVVNQTVLNVRADGTVVWNRKTMALPDLSVKLKELSRLFPDYAIIVRGDERVPFRFIAAVLDTCREANIWNVAFATSKAE
ncbi:MAG: biopolymer transporter ExbD [Chthoniobacter sp.]|uniref:ExbD/TolR family protein n=1 Tax=Chthoniobacter sp. TaxID=2510640 RepID=UPI0032AD2E9B